MGGTVHEAGHDGRSEEAGGPAYEQATRPILPVHSLLRIGHGNRIDAAPAYRLRSKHGPEASLGRLLPQFVPRLQDLIDETAVIPE